MVPINLFKFYIFRYKHVSVRINAEESAFYEAEHFEYVRYKLKMIKSSNVLGRVQSLLKITALCTG